MVLERVQAQLQDRVLDPGQPVGQVRMNLVTVSLDAPNISFEELSPTYVTSRKKVSQFGAWNNALTAVNGDFFDMARTRIHDNLKHGISFFKRTGVGRIGVGIGATDCGDANDFYCYGSGNYGVVAYDFVDVNAELNAWGQTSPVPGADFLGLDTGPAGDTGTVDADPYCSPAPVSCL